MVQEERRQRVRRISDDCTQCEIYKIKIKDFEKAFEMYKERNDKVIEHMHDRISQRLSWKVFGLVITLYLGLAVFNAFTIKSLAVDVGKVQVSVEATREKVNDLQRNMYRR
jgi:cell division protein FtsB